MFRRKYFERRQEHNARYPDDLKKIREYLNSIGTLETSEAELEKLYSEFSEDCYSAGWLGLHEETLEHFADWLENYKG